MNTFLQNRSHEVVDRLAAYGESAREYRGSYVNRLVVRICVNGT